MPRLSTLAFALATTLTAFAAPDPAQASQFTVPAGPFQLDFSVTDVTTITFSSFAYITRDPSLCPSCVTSFTDTYSVTFLGPLADPLGTANGSSTDFYNNFTSGHALGVHIYNFAVPIGTTSLTIANMLSLVGSTATTGFLTIIPLDGELTLTSPTYEEIAGIPIPPTLFLLASPLLALVGRRMRRA